MSWYCAACDVELRKVLAREGFDALDAGEGLTFWGRPENPITRAVKAAQRRLAGKP